MKKKKNLPLRTILPVLVIIIGSFYLLSQGFPSFKGNQSSNNNTDADSQIKITIVEGTTLPQIADNLASILNRKPKAVLADINDESFIDSLIDKYSFLTKEIKRKEIQNPLEGYLYPDTYLFEKDVTVEEIIIRALDSMDYYLSKNRASIKAMGWTYHEFLTMASIVERESFFDEDKPMIAGVFMNRLNIDMKLQSDVTVNYAWGRSGVDVKHSHLEIDSPYNTYKYSGLPIGPISTVSSVTMNSCLNYEKHDYLFFFGKEDGSVIYSETYEEHEKAVAENKWY